MWADVCLPFSSLRIRPFAGFVKRENRILMNKIFLWGIFFEILGILWDLGGVGSPFLPLTGWGLSVGFPFFGGSIVVYAPPAKVMPPLHRL